MCVLTQPATEKPDWAVRTSNPGCKGRLFMAFTRTEHEPPLTYYIHTVVLGVTTIISIWVSVYTHLYIWYIFIYMYVYRFAARRGPSVIGRVKAHEPAISTLHYAPRTSTPTCAQTCSDNNFFTHYYLFRSQWMAKYLSSASCTTKPSGFVDIDTVAM